MTDKKLCYYHYSLTQNYSLIRGDKDFNGDGEPDHLLKSTPVFIDLDKYDIISSLSLLGERFNKMMHDSLCGKTYPSEYVENKFPKDVRDFCDTVQVQIPSDRVCKKFDDIKPDEPHYDRRKKSQVDVVISLKIPGTNIYTFGSTMDSKIKFKLNDGQYVKPGSKVSIKNSNEEFFVMRLHPYYNLYNDVMNQTVPVSVALLAKRITINQQEVDEDGKPPVDVISPIHLLDWVVEYSTNRGEYFNQAYVMLGSISQVYSVPANQ